MSQELHRDTYLSLRSVLHAVGLQECAKRDFFARGTGTIGIHLWTFRAIREIESLKKRGLWEGNVPNEATVRRRANYLASEDWIDEGIPRPMDEPPLWEHLRLQVRDLNPYKGMDVVEMQSGYKPK